jgi:hypothetical protein
MLAAIDRPSANRHWLKAIRGLLRAAVPTMRRDDSERGERPAVMSPEQLRKRYP